MIEPIEVVNEILGNLQKSVLLRDAENERVFKELWDKRTQRGYACFGPEPEEEAALDRDYAACGERQTCYREFLSLIESERQRIVREHMCFQH